MKNLILKFLGLTLIFAAFMACSNDDDSTPVINDVMVAYNTDSGMFSAINTSTGQLTSLGTITMNGVPILGLRDIVYNPSNKVLYASSRANDPFNGKIYSINTSTLEATVINDNADEDWDAIPGLELSNGKLMGTVYWDDFDPGYSTGLVWLNFDGTVDDYSPLMHEGDDYGFHNGMALEYMPSGSQILVVDDDEIVVSDLNGNVSEIIELTEVGFPDNEFLDSLRSLEHDSNGTLFGIDRDGRFGSINLTTGVFNYITTLTPESDNFMALSLIPENIFN